MWWHRQYINRSLPLIFPHHPSFDKGQAKLPSEIRICGLCHMSWDICGILLKCEYKIGLQFIFDIFVKWLEGWKIRPDMTRHFMRRRLESPPPALAACLLLLPVPVLVLLLLVVPQYSLPPISEPLPSIPISNRTSNQRLPGVVIEKYSLWKREIQFTESTKYKLLKRHTKDYQLSSSKKLWHRFKIVFSETVFFHF